MMKLKPSLLAIAVIAASLLLLPSCAATKQADPFDAALSAAMLQMLTAPAPAVAQEGGAL